MRSLYSWPRNMPKAAAPNKTAQAAALKIDESLLAVGAGEKL
jgi:hypothetical protein